MWTRCLQGEERVYGKALMSERNILGAARSSMWLEQGVQAEECKRKGWKGRHRVEDGSCERF